MATLTSKAITELLLSPPAAPNVTLYMPTHQTHSPPNMTEDQVRFKNLRSRAMDIIHNTPDIDTKSTGAVDTQLEQLQGDLSFWEEQRNGLVVFANPYSITTFQLPLDCDEYVAVDIRFHVSPLLGLLTGMLEYYVLLVSQKEPLLFMGDMYDLRQADTPLPVSGNSGSLTLMEKKTLQRLPPERPDSQPAYFGSPFPVTNNDERLLFFRQIDRAIRETANTKYPLILAGTEADIADFRGISSYPNILSGKLPNATTEADIRRLFPEALSIIRSEIIGKRRQDAIARFEQLLGNGSGLASSELPAVEDAANSGRIESLLIRMIRMTTDNVRSDGATMPKLVFLPDEQMAVADYIAVQTWRNHGDIVPMEDTATVATPTGTVLSAIFRY